MVRVSGYRRRKPVPMLTTPWIRRHESVGNPEIEQLASAYLQQARFPPYRPHVPVKVDPARGKRIAEAYDALPSFDADMATISAYSAFKREIEDQYDFVIRSGLVGFEFTSGDPYPDSAAMRADVRDNHRLRVFTGGEPHPFLGAANNKFRAVHDLFGHAMRGFEFGPSGEENAWMEHSAMFSRHAQSAMTTETRGQNSWFNYSKVNEGKPVSQKVFAEQKVALLPQEFWP